MDSHMRRTITLNQNVIRCRLKKKFNLPVAKNYIVFHMFVKHCLLLCKSRSLRPMIANKLLGFNAQFDYRRTPKKVCGRLNKLKRVIVRIIFNILYFQLFVSSPGLGWDCSVERRTSRKVMGRDLNPAGRRTNNLATPRPSFYRSKQQFCKV